METTFLYLSLLFGIASAALMHHVVVRKKLLQQIALFVTIVRTIRQMDSVKKVSPARSNPNAVAWPEPKLDALVGEKILWGFWHNGLDGMPLLCQLAVHSWKVRNPDWKVVIVSDANYKYYVSFSDIPSTFDSLLAEHRSDILRIAVLVRYGGIYLDASTFVNRCFDQVWEELDDSLAIPDHVTFAGTNLTFYNNAVLMAKKPQNAVLLAWLKRINDYMEDPCTTNENVLAHPAFHRIRKYLRSDALGIGRDVLPYIANLLLFCDLIWYEPQLQKLVLKLPVADYGFGVFCLNYHIRRILAERKGAAASTVPDLRLDVRLVGFMKETIFALPFFIDDDRDLVDRLATKLTIVKLSTMSLKFFDLNGVSTMARLIHGASDVNRYPTAQATITAGEKAVHTP